MCSFTHNLSIVYFHASVVGGDSELLFWYRRVVNRNCRWSSGVVDFVLPVWRGSGKAGSSHSTGGGRGGLFSSVMTFTIDDGTVLIALRIGLCKNRVVDGTQFLVGLLS